MILLGHRLFVLWRLYFPFFGGFKILEVGLYLRINSLSLSPLYFGYLLTKKSQMID